MMVRSILYMALGVAGFSTGLAIDHMIPAAVAVPIATVFFGLALRVYLIIEREAAR